MKDFIQNLKFTWNYAKEEKKYLILSIILNVLSIFFKIILPVLSARVIIELTNNHYIQIIFVAFVILIVSCLEVLCYCLFRRLILNVHKTSFSNIEKDLGKNILKIENKVLDEKGSGIFIQRLTSDTRRLSEIFSTVLDNITDIIKYIGILIAIFIVNKLVFIYMLMMIIFTYLLEKKRTDIKKRDDERYRKSNEKLSGFIGELVRGSRDIKMLNSEKDFIDKLDEKIDKTNTIFLDMQKTSWRYLSFTWQIYELNAFLLILLLVFLMKQNILSAPIALVLYNYFTSLSNFSYITQDLLESAKDFNLSTERIKDILNNQEFKKEQFGQKHLDKIEGNFEFNDVSFSYNDSKILNHLSFKINANETVAFVGKSGAGKTTIFNLLCKMYDIDEGVISIDGVNIKDLDKDSIRGNITIISQNPYIFNMSIRDNLKLVKRDLTEDEMKEALKVACLDDFIKSLPNQYDTIVGEGGVTLSGGQRQRLAIARALIQKTEIILFDEATSALDNETQSKIQEAIEHMKKEYTILIIAHRLSTIINTDRILYLEDGKIVCEGTHQELLEKSLEYKKLYESENINKEE